MTRRWLRALPILAVLFVAGCTTGTATTTNLVDVQGADGVAGTGKFDTLGAWDLKLTYDCSRQLDEKVPGASTGVSLTVYNADDQSEAFEHPESQWKGAEGTQRLHFTRPGPYSVAVDSKCDWHVTVVDSGGNS